MDGYCCFTQIYVNDIRLLTQGCTSAAATNQMNTHSRNEKSGCFFDVDVLLGRRLKPGIKAVLLAVISHFFVVTSSGTVLHLITLDNKKKVLTYLLHSATSINCGHDLAVISVQSWKDMPLDVIYSK